MAERVHTPVDSRSLVDEDVGAILRKQHCDCIENLRGEPASWPSAFTALPSDSFTLPIFEATTNGTPPAFGDCVFRLF